MAKKEALMSQIYQKNITSKREIINMRTTAADMKSVYNSEQV